ncbi:unnamed protein product [Rhizoctonia solani]|uniref:Uncharacterized protein n=1 Tax=Rhizoctonia solani TaxID=456999 RepID=A0A8H3E150_9AGAM|nr:unnamed protein product [Rhizoctonia solani]
MSHSAAARSSEATIDAKFNEFLQSIGEPTELNDALLTRYFQSLQEHIGGQTLTSPTKSTLNLLADSPTPMITLSSGGLIIFVVQQLTSDWHISGLTQVIGNFDLGSVFNYKLESGRWNFVRLSITSDDGTGDRIEFVSYLPHKVHEQSGTGTIVQFEDTESRQ